MSFSIYDAATARAGILRRRPPDEAVLSDEARAGLRRVFGRDLSADEAVRTILNDVRHEGDAAVRRYTVLFDGAEPAALEVTPDEIAAAMAALDPAELDAWRLAVEQVEAFHRHQARSGWFDLGPDGALGQIVRPLARVGLYAPGGRNAYPSSLLMAAAPARVAGVGEVIVCTPPRPDGSPRILAVAGLCGVDRVFRIGGAQAIAALAYGTATVPQVDKMLGPGNIFVALAKRQVFGQVAIDQLAGPTETVVIADDTAAPATVAADLLAQAEHDPMASAILLTPSRALAEAVAAARSSASWRCCHGARSPGHRWRPTAAPSSSTMCRRRWRWRMSTRRSISVCWSPIPGSGSIRSSTPAVSSSAMTRSR